MNYIGHPDSYFLWVSLPEKVRVDRIAAALRLALGSLPLPTLREALTTVKRVIQLHCYL
ncbi:hypothetical protein H8I69_13255 [Serratia fonticola]|uniref:hypothetical protein n=1 Tax=Serratia fonticola TaxID=47917 RepID=UPI0015C65E5C|nr:hypothetical protein [Serratia fonticola]MBC3380074.1 hypothetical protein [Serratia fonticola]NYA39273.1 hypothetical protein [Serratia fonticola]